MHLSGREPPGRLPKRMRRRHRGDRSPSSGGNLPSDRYLTHSSYSLQHRFMDIIVSIFFEKASPNFAKGGKFFRNGRTADKTYRPPRSAPVAALMERLVRGN